MNGFVWYSYGSDTTGAKLAEELGFKKGKKTPQFRQHDILLGWGCKPGEKYNSDGLGELIKTGAIRVLNHPEAVHANRDKLAAVERMDENGISVPGYAKAGGSRNLQVAVLRALEKGEIDFPLLALNRHHKGYPIFCYTVEDITRVFESSEAKNIDYFRSFYPGEEFKIYVFRDTVLAAERKILATNPQKQLSEHLLKKLQRRAQRAEVQLQATNQELSWVAEELAGELVAGPHHMQKSVTHGWELADVPLKKVPAEVASQAINAVEAVGLDMGAVSVTQDGKNVWVTNVISAPGLSEEQMNLFVSSIREFSKAKGARKKTRAPKEVATQEPAPKELVASLKRKIAGVTKTQAAEVLRVLGG